MMVRLHGGKVLDFTYDPNYGWVADDIAYFVMSKEGTKARVIDLGVTKRGEGLQVTIKHINEAIADYENILPDEDDEFFDNCPRCGEEMFGSQCVFCGWNINE